MGLWIIIGKPSRSDSCDLGRMLASAVNLYHLKEECFSSVLTEGMHFHLWSMMSLENKMSHGWFV